MNRTFVLVMLAILGLSGCSHFKVTAAMCDNINKEHGELPEECRNYNEEEADKAFHKIKDANKVSGKDLEFDVEKNGE